VPPNLYVYGSRPPHVSWPLGFCLYERALGKTVAERDEITRAAAAAFPMPCSSGGNWYIEDNGGITASTDDHVPKLRCPSFMRCPSHDLPR
jgi:hypothetical protein